MYVTLHATVRTSLIGAFLFLGFAAPASAHNVEVAEDVAATMHIEPNHNPKSGEPALTWFALTRRGGQLIPLEQCNCKLRVYPNPYKAGAPPVLEPALSAIDAEQYRGIPGARVVFPKSGQYTLEISGSPKAGVDFKPFELRYGVTVLTGVPASPQRTVSEFAQTPASESTSSSPTSAAQPLLIAGTIGLGAAVTFWLQRRKK